MRRTRTLVVVLAVGASAFALVSCGGDDRTGAGDAETTAITTETTETTDPTETTPTTDETETETVGEAGGTLLGTVGPGFTISLTTESGEDVSTLSPGTYTIEVDDRSDIHNFHLTGPGLDESTSVSETGEATWEVTLEAGSHSFVCDPHQTSINGSFEVSG